MPFEPQFGRPGLLCRESIYNPQFLSFCLRLHSFRGFLGWPLRSNFCDNVHRPVQTSAHMKYVLGLTKNIIFFS